MTANTIRLGAVVELDEIDAVTADRWTGFVLSINADGAIGVVRCYRNRLDTRTISDPATIIDTRPGWSRDMHRTAEDIARSGQRAKRGEALRIATIAARLDELATLRRTEELDEERERQTDRVAEFNTELRDARSPAREQTTITAGHTENHSKISAARA